MVTPGPRIEHLLNVSVGSRHVMSSNAHQMNPANLLGRLQTHRLVETR
jgi:hypothetical protein